MRLYEASRVSFTIFGATNFNPLINTKLIEMIEQKKPTSVDLYIQKIRTSLMAEFGRIDLPLEVQILVRNRASKDGISTIQALDVLISEKGSLSNVTEVAKKNANDARKVARRTRKQANKNLTKNSKKRSSFFGSITLIKGAPPYQGGGPS